MPLPLRKLRRADLRVTDGDPHLNEEWLVTNGLGGYASGTVAGPLTRRYHGLLIAALPNPLGRTMTLNALSERIRLPNRDVYFTGPNELVGVDPPGTLAPREFSLEGGLPVWRYEIGGFTLEKRILMVYRQNTVHVKYKLVTGPAPIRSRDTSAGYLKGTQHPTSCIGYSLSHADGLVSTCQHSINLALGNHESTRSRR